MPESDDPTSPARRLVQLAPIVVLLLAVLAQAVLMQTVNADRQSGSGFAMFSSVDFAGSRAVTATATVEGRAVEVVLSSRFDADVDELLRQPTDARATEFANLLLSTTWRIDAQGRATRGLDPIDAVAVTVRGLDADGRTLRSVVLAEAVVP